MGQIDDLKAALLESITSIGQRSGAPALEEIVVDGRYYELNVRINRSFKGTFGVSENDARLFDPLDAVVRAVGRCSENAAWQARRHDF